MNVLVAPSILSADFAEIKNEIKLVEQAGADWIHIDVMDGWYVPNITIGPGVISSIKKHTNLPFDVHLMIEKPNRYIEDFVRAGADILSIHPEACSHPHRVLKNIHSYGIKAGVVLNPHTPIDSIYYILEEVDLILVMTVNPGFGGQVFISSLIEKIKNVRKLIEESGKNIYLEVDGGINTETGKLVCEAGANVLVSGHAIFKNSDPASVVKAMKNIKTLSR